MSKPLYAKTQQALIRGLQRDVDRLKRRGPGPKHVVGGTGEPAFQNGWTQVAGYADTAFWFGLDGLLVHLAVEGGTAGSTIFTLPTGYYIAGIGNVSGTGSANPSAFRAWHIDTSTGDVVDGV